MTQNDRTGEVIGLVLDLIAEWPTAMIRDFFRWVGVQEAMGVPVLGRKRREIAEDCLQLLLTHEGCQRARLHTLCREMIARARTRIITTKYAKCQARINSKMVALKDELRRNRLDVTHRGNTPSFSRPVSRVDDTGGFRFLSENGILKPHVRSQSSAPHTETSRVRTRDPHTVARRTSGAA